VVADVAADLWNRISLHVFEQPEGKDILSGVYKVFN
jgi:hypothetical protein